ncbi:hypothetical protein FACS1894187_13830 [Synergistales bacterium]|nr:hypothetical protein FACS1894187_13830 [Synergistales bacterium]
MQKLFSLTLRVVSLFLILSLASAKCAVSASPLTLEDRANMYIGKTYVANPLAKAASNGFDCTTYVETVLTEGYADPDIALNLIRYRDGEVGFFTRNHFMENMWIPNAVKHGFISPIAFADTDKSSIYVDATQWYLDNPEIAEPDKDAAYCRQARKQGWFRASVYYVPVSRINDILLADLSDGTVVFFLRTVVKPPRWLRNDNAVMITHMGLLFGGSRLYHASSARREVAVEDFLGYLKTNSGVRGVAFYKVTR